MTITLPTLSNPDLHQDQDHHPDDDDSRPRVIIVGAGLGGLTLAVLLERAQIEYLVLERSAKVVPLGSAMALGSGILPLFKQIGIYDQFVDAGKPILQSRLYNESRELEFVMDLAPGAAMGGYDQCIVARPVLHEILRRQVPPAKMYMGKKVLFTEENDFGVTLHCSDGSCFRGDVLVGADGAYSSVRQSMYKKLRDEGKLPKVDDVDLPYSCVCLVGQTMPLDPEEFPDLKKRECSAQSVVADKDPYSWTTFTTKANTICWMVIQYLDAISSKTNDSFRNSEWGPEAAEQMCKEVRSFALPSTGGVVKEGEGGLRTIGDLIDRTPKHLISKVMLEEKVFETWNSQRTVLLGDACHKVNPAGGLGALCAMQDAITLANWINVLPSTGLSDLKEVFKEYRAERLPVAKEAFASSQQVSRMYGKHNWVNNLLRGFMKRMPRWLWMIILTKSAASRPQVSFLPLVPDQGTVPAQVQPSLVKTARRAAKAGRKNGSGGDGGGVGGEMLEAI